VDCAATTPRFLFVRREQGRCDHLQPITPMTSRSLRDISLKGVVLGATSDIVATNLLLAPVAIYFFARLDQSLPSAQKSAAFTRAFTEDPQLYLIGMILGCTASIFGGWVAARIARRAELLNGALSAVACVGFGIYGMTTHADVAPLWQHVAFFVLSPALGAFGGAIRRRQHARVEPEVLDVAAPSVEPAHTDLQGLGWALYVGNRIVAGIGVLGFLVFGLVGLAGYSEHKSSLILGSAIVCAFVAAVVVLLQVAARLLRAGRRTHWAYHGGALAVASMIVALLALGMSVAKHS
jgi:hypothetical protein